MDRQLNLGGPTEGKGLLKGYVYVMNINIIQ